MSREIKFRGIIKDSGQWVYGYLINDYNTGEGFYIAENLYHVDGAEFNIDAYKVVTETVGEFSGLKDRNGKEIYESDVLSHPFGVVKFIDGCFCIDDLPFSNQYVDLADLEVIGNIHSNPELLKP